MAVKDKLRDIFGWSGASAPSDTSPRAKDNSARMGSTNPYEIYSNNMKLPESRRKRYDIFEAMDEMETISSILDAYAEDCTQENRGKKKSVWITAADKKVKDILDAMLERVKAEEWIEGCHRDLAQFGDDFCQLSFKEGIGITGVDWRHPSEIERIENMDGTLVGFEETKKLGEIQQSLQRAETPKYSYKPWDFIHFRLYKRKRKKKQKFRNIYGTSVLEGSEKATKRVMILDDLLMIRRLTKTLDTRKYDVDVSNASVEEAVMILKRWKNSMKRKAFIDPANSRFDTPFDPITFQEDIFWPKSEGSESGVDVIPGQPNVSDIVDIEYFEDKMFGSLRAPKGYFGREGDINAKATLSSQDIKWGRSCNSIQQGFRNGIFRMCQIELALHDMKSTEFTVHTTIASVLEEISRMEVEQIMIDVAERKASLGESLGLDSEEWRNHILRDTLGMTDQDIKKYSGGGGIAPDDDVEFEKLHEIVRLALIQRLGSSITERASSRELPTKKTKLSSRGEDILPITIPEDDSESNSVSVN